MKHQLIKYKPFVGFSGLENNMDVISVLQCTEALPKRNLGVGHQIFSAATPVVKDFFPHQGTYNFLDVCCYETGKLRPLITRIKQGFDGVIHGLHIAGTLSKSLLGKIKADHPAMNLVLSLNFYDLLLNFTDDKTDLNFQRLFGIIEVIDCLELTVDNHLSPKAAFEIFSEIKKCYPEKLISVCTDFSDQELAPVVQELLESFPDLSWTMNVYHAGPQQIINFLRQSREILENFHEAQKAMKSLLPHSG